MNIDKLGIFGDSFSCIYTKWDLLDYAVSTSNRGLSWVELIEDHFQCKVTNYSRPGSPFNFSLDLYLKERHKYDFCFLVVSSPYRVHVKNTTQLCMNYQYLQTVIENLKLKEQTEEVISDREIIESVSIYLEKWMDFDLVQNVQMTVVDYILNNHPNTFIIPGFKESCSFSNIGLCDLAHRELHLLDPRYSENVAITHDYRKCHFSKENNRVIFDKIIESLGKNKRSLSLNITDVIRPSKPISYYVDLP